MQLLTTLKLLACIAPLHALTPPKSHVAPTPSVRRRTAMRACAAATTRRMRYASAAEPARKPRNRGREGAVDGLLTVGVVATSRRESRVRSLRTPQSSKRPSQRISTSSKKYHRAGSTAPVKKSTSLDRRRDSLVDFHTGPHDHSRRPSRSVDRRHGRVALEWRSNAKSSNWARGKPTTPCCFSRRRGCSKRSSQSCARRAWRYAATSRTPSSRRARTSTSKIPATDDDAGVV